jgi:hypothetical protein
MIQIEMAGEMTVTEEVVITIAETETIVVTEIEIETTTAVDVTITAVVPLPPSVTRVIMVNQRYMASTLEKLPIFLISDASWSWMVS